jgi:hypothetical protein
MASFKKLSQYSLGGTKETTVRIPDWPEVADLVPNKKNIRTKRFLCGLSFVF